MSDKKPDTTFDAFQLTRRDIVLVRPDDPDSEGWELG